MANLSSTKSGEAQALARPAIRSLHHFSFRCIDAEETRRFYEDFLGLEFCAALPTTVEVAGKQVEALQLLFRMLNGNFFSFYNVPGDVRPEMYKPLGPFDAHFAMKVASEAQWDNWVERLTKAGIHFVGPMDHAFIRSVYFMDPNGVWLEITYQYANHEEFLAHEKAVAEESMSNWNVKTAEHKAKYIRSFAVR